MVKKHQLILMKSVLKYIRYNEVLTYIKLGKMWTNVRTEVEVVVNRVASRRDLLEVAVGL